MHDLLPLLFCMGIIRSKTSIGSCTGFMSNKGTPVGEIYKRCRFAPGYEYYNF
jgi:hypothetical protein